MHFGTAYSSIPGGEKNAYAIAFPLPAFPHHQAPFSPPSIPLFFQHHRVGLVERDLPSLSHVSPAHKRHSLLGCYAPIHSCRLFASVTAHSSIPVFQVLIVDCLSWITSIQLSFPFLANALRIVFLSHFRWLSSIEFPLSKISFPTASHVPIADKLLVFGKKFQW